VGGYLYAKTCSQILRDLLFRRLLPRQSIYPLNYITFVFFTICTGAWFGISSPGWGNNGNWQIMGNITVVLVMFTFLATRTTPSSCFVSEGQEDSPGVWVDCEFCMPLCGMQDPILGPPPKPAHVPGGRRVVFSLVGASTIAYLIQLVIASTLVGIYKYSDPGAFIVLQLFTFSVSW